MNTPICEQLGIDFPLFGFSHCRDVVAAVSKAGGMGVLGIAGFSPDVLEEALHWMDRNVDGHPYAVDLIVPAAYATKGQKTSAKETVSLIPTPTREFVRHLLASHDIDTQCLSDEALLSHTDFAINMEQQRAMQCLEVAFAHPIRLIVNALGPPPDYMMHYARAQGVPVGALAGAKQHAIRLADAGVDLVIAAGGEAGGHCGDISTLVLVPEVVEALRPYGDIPVLAAGGIVTGRQMAACMAMGAAGAWTGSVWLTTPESDTSPVIKQKLLSATASDTVRSRARTGKHSRQLRSEWTRAWESREALPPLPMPLQSVLVEPALAQIVKRAEMGHQRAQALASYWVGQGVGLMNSTQSARQIVQAFREDFVDATERLQTFVSE